MTNASLVDRARQGDSEAIALLMNQSLEAHRIRVRAWWQDQCFRVAAEGAAVPDQDFLVEFVRRGMLGLGCRTLAQVVIEAYGPGAAVPAWSVLLDLVPVPLSEGGGSLRDAPERPVPDARLRVPVETGARPGRPGARVATAVRRPGPMVTRLRRSPGRWGLFAVALVSAIAIAVLVRLCLVMLAESTVYRAPFVGDVLHSLEVAEFLNLLSFAVLGMGMGLVAAIARSPWGWRLAGGLTIALVPLLFALSPMVRHHLWIEAIAADRAMPVVQVQGVANGFLRDHVGDGGLWGFYRYTAQSAIVPVTAEEMQTAATLDQQVNTLLAGLLRQEGDRVARWMEWGSWGLRFFYFMVAAASALSHFRRGMRLGWRWFQTPAGG
ncbi:MAG: hypothetical protein MH825_13490 [Cyanobacteria bacterium]|nr:hypothetical protein [Cyanobacteriota bacterium]